ncbi:MAG: sulfatase-like hydrolase/transferase [Paludibacteraceae bacterium]|nr:sulfatase-like hydrolase/transferase [Paludibacteraceae bacterium]
MNKIWHHPLVVAMSNLLLIMLFYTLQRLFFYYINTDIFTDISTTHLFEILLGGLRFDLTALLYLNSVYLVLLLLPFRFRSNSIYQQTAKWLFIVSNSIGIIINCADMVYFRFSDRRTTFRIFTEFQNEGNLLSILFSSIVQYWYVTVFAILIIALLVFLTRQKICTTDRRSNPLYYPTETLILLVCIYFTVIGIRGGFGKYTRPITISNAMQYADKPQETALVLNTPFTLMKSVENTPYRNPHYFPKEQLATIFTPIKEQKEQNKEGKSTNVVIFILESFSKEYIGFYNPDLQQNIETGFTPFLDSLLHYSATFRTSLASGRKSIDAMPSVLSSIPMLIEPYIVTPYSTNAVSSIAECLKNEGYQTAFFHGAPNGSMGFQAYARSAGFQKYYGMTEYLEQDYATNHDFDGTWAIWDEEFLKFYGITMSNMQEPFLTAVFTASSHHPFRVPLRYENRFSKGTLPIHQCIGYSDNALRQFFQYAKQQTWYDNTLFVFTADHTNRLKTEKYNNAKGLYEIPIAFYKPDNSLQGKKEIPFCQTDIMPTVLGYLGYDKAYFAFGNDKSHFLTTNKTDSLTNLNNYIVNYNHPLYQIFSDSLLLQFDGKDICAIYDYQADPMLKNNLKDSLLNDSSDCAPNKKEAQQMLLYLKAYIQQYISRMIENRLTTQTD